MGEEERTTCHLEFKTSPAILKNFSRNRRRLKEGGENWLEICWKRSCEREWLGQKGGRGGGKKGKVLRLQVCQPFFLARTYREGEGPGRSSRRRGERSPVKKNSSEEGGRRSVGGVEFSAFWGPPVSEQCAVRDNPREGSRKIA